MESLTWFVEPDQIKEQIERAHGDLQDGLRHVHTMKFTELSDTLRYTDSIPFEKEYITNMFYFDEPQSLGFGEYRNTFFFVLVFYGHYPKQCLGFSNFRSAFAVFKHHYQSIKYIQMNLFTNEIEHSTGLLDTIYSSHPHIRFVLEKQWTFTQMKKYFESFHSGPEFNSLVLPFITRKWDETQLP